MLFFCPKIGYWLAGVGEGVTGGRVGEMDGLLSLLSDADFSRGANGEYSGFLVGTVVTIGVGVSSTGGVGWLWPSNWVVASPAAKRRTIVTIIKNSTRKNLFFGRIIIVGLAAGGSGGITLSAVTARTALGFSLGGGVSAGVGIGFLPTGVPCGSGGRSGGLVFGSCSTTGVRSTGGPKGEIATPSLFSLPLLSSGGQLLGVGTLFSTAELILNYLGKKFQKVNSRLQFA